MLSQVFVIHVGSEMRLCKSLLLNSSCKNSFLDFGILVWSLRSTFKSPSRSRFSYLPKVWSRIFDSSLKNDTKSNDGSLQTV